MECVETLLNIESPTNSEEKIYHFTKDFFAKFYPHVQFFTSGFSFIATTKTLKPNCPHLALVGHTDVVPEFFKAYEKEGRLHGAGASDMKGALGVYLELLKNEGENLFEKYNVSFIFYAKEEQTPMNENGLFELIKDYPNFFKSLDLAIVGEPTDNQIHIGCVGSLHVHFEILGEACHSARPWNGENALYKALAFLQNVAKFEPQKHTVFGVDFFDVIQVTEFQVEPGRTSLPGWARGNINFRFAPVYNLDEAQNFLEEKLKAWGLKESEYTILDLAPAAKVIENDIFQKSMSELKAPIQAKQAWTDVAQFSLLGISAFNFGPGLTAQAHKDNEYILLKDLQTYYESLKRFLI